MIFIETVEEVTEGNQPLSLGIKVRMKKNLNYRICTVPNEGSTHSVK